MFYNDEARIAMYEAMPAEQFKELVLSMLKYKYGDDSIVESISDPMVKAIFLKEKVEIDRNEQRWEEIREVRRQAGKKGGRPSKEEREESEEQPNQRYLVSFDTDIARAKELYQTGNWWYTHHLNDMKNKYNMDYQELKSLVEV